MATPPPNPDDAPRRGRPPKLTEEVALGVALAILDGCFRYQAARRYDVTPRTVQRWMKAGRKYPDGIYGQFRRLVLESESEFECRAVRTISRAGHEDDPAHLQWLLERKHPQRWGRYRGELGLLKKRIADLEKLLGELSATADQAAE